MSFPLSSVLPWNLALAGLVALCLGITLGTYAGARRNRLPDHITRVVWLEGASLPQFWFGILLLIVFWAHLGVAPIGRSDASLFLHRLTIQQEFILLMPCWQALFSHFGMQFGI